MADLSAIDALRDEIATLRATITREQQLLRELRDAPLNVRDATAELESYIERRAEEYENLATAHSFTAPAAVGPGALLPQGTNPEAFACFFFGDHLRKTLQARFTGICPPSLDRAARRPLIRAAEARVLELERQEETLIEQALAAGVSVIRRPDADPRAVLNDGDD